MPGLLSKGGFDDPLTMGLLGASQALMTPMSQGGGVGAAFNAFPAAQQQAMRQQFLRQQMEGQQSEAELRRAQLMAAQEEARRKIELDSRRQDLFGRIGMQPLTQALAAEAAALGIKPAELADIANAGRAKVARTFEVMGPNNLPQTRQVDDYGNQVGADFAKPVEMRMADLGGSLSPYNPFAPPSSFTKTMTPGEIASNRVAMGNLGVAQANLGLSRDRLAMDTRNAGINNGQVLPDQGLIVDKKTGATIPILVGGQPMVPAGKAPTEAQTRDNLFASRADAADKIINALGSKPSIVGAAMQNNIAGFPVIGGATAAGQNYFLSPETRQYNQAKRSFINAVLRKESGAVIGKDEFESADRQYFPQPNDDAVTIQQKAADRRRQIEGIALGAGPLGRGGAAASPPSGGRPPLSSFGAP